METTSIALLAVALIAAPAAVAAGGGFQGLPGAADYGMCMAGQHAHENATAQAPPFQSNATHAEDCDTLKPGQDDAEDGADAEASEHRQDSEHREDDAAREDGRAYGHQQAEDRRPDGAGPP